MKRIISIILAVCFLLSAAAFAEMGMAAQMNNEAVFNQAVSLLQYYHQPESIQQAADIFSNLPGSYNQASYYKIYAQLLMDLHNELYADVLGRLDTLKELSGYDAFKAALQEKRLPSCDSLYIYTQARRAESELRYSDAYELYKKTDFLDSPERALALRGYKPATTSTPIPSPTSTVTPMPEPTQTPDITPEPEIETKPATNPYFFTYDISGSECIITGYTGDAAEVIIPAEINGCTVTSIAANAFYYCNFITSVSIPDGVTSIGDCAFYSCSSLTEVSLPESITSIGGGAFAVCSSLIDISLPESVTSIGSSAFSYCDSLTSISIPDHTASIGSNPFSGCESLTEIKLSDNHPIFTLIDGVLFDKMEKELICYPCSLEAETYAVPQGTLSIGDAAFPHCDSIRSISIPDSVTYIGSYAFCFCNSLSEVHFANGISARVAKDAFDYCDSLTSVNYPKGISFFKPKYQS